jgi:hypothetical protein
MDDPKRESNDDKLERTKVMIQSFTGTQLHYKLQSKLHIICHFNKEATDDQ